MRRLVVLLTLLALAVPLAAAASQRVVGDGTLSVRDLVSVQPGVVSVSIRARGALIGRCDQCTFRLDDLAPNGGGVPIVTGAEQARDIDKDGSIEFYRGRDVRWKIIGGWFHLQIRQGHDVDLSVVGQSGPRGVRLRGSEGKYSVNGGDAVPVPPEFAIFQLGSDPAAP